MPAVVQYHTEKIKFDLLEIGVLFLNVMVSSFSVLNGIYLVKIIFSTLLEGRCEPLCLLDADLFIV